MKTAQDFTEFVWHLGKVWFNPRRPNNSRGEIILWSLKEDSAGIQAETEKVRNCTQEEMDAIKYFRTHSTHTSPLKTTKLTLWTLKSSSSARPR
jgi:hypothetical protein